MPELMVGTSGIGPRGRWRSDRTPPTGLEGRQAGLTATPMLNHDQGRGPLA